MPTVTEILSLAPGASYLAANQVQKSVLFNNQARLNPLLPQQIYALYFVLKKIYDNDPIYDGLVPTANYLWEIMGRYGIAAQGLTGGGGSVTPVTPSVPIKSPIKITGTDFVSATEWEGANSDSISILPSYTLQVFYNDIQRFLDEGSEWNRTSTGVEITLAGFDAITFPTVILYIYISP